MPPKTQYSQVSPRGIGAPVLRRALPLFRPYRGRMLLAGIFIALVGLCVATPPLFTKYVIDTAIPRHDFRLVVLIMAGFVGLMLLRMVMWYIGQSILLWVRESVIFHLRSAVFTRLQHLCMRFHQQYSPGYLFDRTLGGASTSVGMFLSMLFNTLVTYVFTFISALVICLKLHSGLTLWVLGMSIGYVFISRYFGARIHALTRDFNKAMNEFAGQVTDMLRGVKTIKAFAMEQRMISEFDENLWPLQVRSLHLNKETMLMSFMSEGLGYAINAAILVTGAYLVLQQKISLGTLVAFAGYQALLISIFSAMANIAGTYGAATAGLEQMYEILDERPSVVERPGATMPEEVHGEIVLRDVHFSYDGKPVLQGVNLQVPPGESVALVGPSGGGKTTLTNLLLRLYDPDAGTITLDGRDIRELPLAPYRGLFGVVLQDPFLFNDSVLNNLLAVRPEATEEELRGALERAQAWDFVQGLKDGWHFRVGEGGSQLSGGQRQRIALARCFLTDAQIIVLDEATSALDNQSERLVQQALYDLMRNRTVFVIAHRLSTVRHVNRILVLADGQLVQQGTFDELAATPGLFRDLHLASLQPLPVPGEACPQQDTVS